MGCTRASRWNAGGMLRRRALAAAALVAAFTANGLAETLTFSRDDYASFAGARAILSADFNRDGWPDIAHANIGRNSVTILLNRSGGAPARAADIPVGAGPFDLTASDFNRDGIPDLAVANADGNSISVLLGRGDGTFIRSDIAAAPHHPRGITAADVNGDARPDLIYTGYATGTVQILIGNGAGGFTKGTAYVSSAQRPQGLATADFNHDGHLDVAVAYAGSAGLRILYGTGGAAFTARGVTGHTYLNIAAVGDLDGDGWMDVAAASTASSSVAIYRGSASGLVHTQTAVVGSSPRGLAIGDVNTDGMLDIVTGNRASSTISVLLGSHAHPGTFLAHVEWAAASGSRAVVVADFDADGRLDLASGNEYAASVTVLSNVTAFDPAAYAFRHTSITGAPPVALSEEVLPADFNRDGRPDLATGAADRSSIVVQLAGGPAISLPVPGYLDALGVADVNGDGNSDLVYAASMLTEEIGAYLGDGRGGFAATPTASVRHVESLAIGDMNRDGRPDLVYVGLDDAFDNVLRIALGRGDGTFILPTTGVILPRRASAVALADVNRDAKLDVIALLALGPGGQAMEVRVWLGNGGAGLTATSWTVPFVSTFGVQFDVADVNHDAYVDIVASEFQQMAVASGGPAGFGPPDFFAVPTAEFLGSVSIADLNVDGNPDVAFGSGDVMFGNGDGAFVSGGRFDHGGRIAEFTGDGLPDIVAATERGVIVLANTRDTANLPPTVNAGPDRTIAFADTQGGDCHANATASATDPDAHWLTYEWRRDGVLVSNDPTVYFCGLPPASYAYSVTVRDGRGGMATDTVAVTILPIKEIVLWASDTSTDGRWTLVDDLAAAGGVRAYDPNLGAPKVTTPAAEPTSIVRLRFFADPTQTYKLWIRLKADGNSWANDSVWVQFSGATDLAGTPKYRIGTTSGLAVNLEECSGCGVSGWGWEDDGWGAVNKNGVTLRFPQDPDRDPQIMVIQTREDGVSIDQIVLSTEKYLTTRPGAAKNDRTILPSTQPPR